MLFLVLQSRDDAEHERSEKDKTAEIELKITEIENLKGMLAEEMNKHESLRAGDTPTMTCPRRLVC